jgi:hypothetical protein
MKKMFIFIKHEFLEMLPPTIFFFVVFHVLAFARALMDKQYGIEISSAAVATIGALIVGKSILIADALSFGNLFHKHRLIYHVAWKTFFYLAIVLLFQLLEELIPLISKYGAISTAGEHFVEEINWHRFWATHIILFVFIAIYNLSTEVIGIIGRKEFIEIFFSPRNNHSTKGD